MMEDRILEGQRTQSPMDPAARNSRATNSRSPILPLILQRVSAAPAVVALPVGSHRARGYESHLSDFGQVAFRESKRLSQEVVALAERWDIRGRGGAGYPLAKKMYSVARQASLAKPAMLIANGSEGEPLSFKDRFLMRSNPHLVFDGIQLAAAATRATDIFLAIHPDPELKGLLLNALSERRTPRQGPRIDVVEVPDRFVSGNETALVSFLERKPALPRSMPPRPSDRGVGGRPTQISNVETLARLGVAYHSEVRGSSPQSGDSGIGYLGTVYARERNFIFEARARESVGEILAAGGVHWGPRSTVLLSGYFGTFTKATPDIMGTPIAGLGSKNLSFGAGLVVVFPEDACLVNEADRAIGWLATQSSGQCGPCMNGLPAIAREFRSITVGEGGDAERIWHWAEQLPRRGACSLPDGYSGLVRSFMQLHLDEMRDHARGTCARRDYAIIEEARTPKRRMGLRGLFS